MGFGSLYKMRITYSYPKDYLGRFGKGLITYLCIKTNVRSNEYKKSRNYITNVSMKDISNIKKAFENYLIRVMCVRVPNINPLAVTFT